MMQGALADGPATNLGAAVLGGAGVPAAAAAAADDDSGDDETDDTIESDGSEYVDETPGEDDDDAESGDIPLPAATGLLQTTAGATAGVGTYDKAGVYCPPGQKPDSQLMGMLQNSAMMGVQQKQQEQMQLQLMRMKMKGIMQANREIKSRMRHMRRHVPGNCDCCQACTG